MDRLPVECLTMILQHVDLNDLLACRRMNKAFRHAVGDVRLKELAVYERDLEYETFFLTRRSNFNCPLFRTANQKFLKSSLIQTIVRKLRSLFIDYHLNTDHLNLLTNLERLQIAHLEITEDGAVLSLPLLKNLCVEDLYEKRLKLNCPSLTEFKINYGLSRVEFVYPDELKHLGIWACEIGLSAFKSLEYLYVKNGSNVSEDILDLLPQLKQLHSFSGLNRSKIANLLQQKAALNRSDFQIFYSGIEFDLFEQLDQINPDVKLDISVLLRCYDKLADKLSWIRNFPISNEHLISLLENVPDKFFTKFYNLKAILVQGTVCQPHFERFLSNYPNLTYLNLVNTSLPQSFYETLIGLCSKLYYLEILNETKKLDDLTFLFNFKLRFLTLDQELPFGVVNHLCRSRPDFVLVLVVGNGVFNLSSCNDGTAQLTGSESVAQFEDLDQAVKFVKNIFSVLSVDRA